MITLSHDEICVFLWIYHPCSIFCICSLDTPSNSHICEYLHKGISNSPSWHLSTQPSYWWWQYIFQTTYDLWVHNILTLCRKRWSPLTFQRSFVFGHIFFSNLFIDVNIGTGWCRRFHNVDQSGSIFISDLKSLPRSNIFHPQMDFGCLLIGKSLGFVELTFEHCGVLSSVFCVII